MRDHQPVDYLRRAFDEGVLCSNDPVCASHSPAADHAERHLEGAACHGCLFIAEPSCERFNQYLQEERDDSRTDTIASPGDRR